MNYKETLNWLFSQLPMYQRVGKAAYKADLHNTIKILSELGNPENQFPAIHIAGTNGKGSVSHIIASVFQEAGYKTGLYTSPHLIDFRERIRINGDLISEEYVVDFIDNNKSAFSKISPSFFEMTVGMAFAYFAEENVDIAIIETGMGGRLDSTNLCNPLLSIVTKIGLDHVSFLGDTIEKIAGEKAGIIKNNIPVIIGKHQQESDKVFIAKAKDCKSDLIFAEDVVDINKIESNNPTFNVYDVWQKNQLLASNLKSPLLGNYQKENIVTSIAACLNISERALFSISIDNISDGIENVISNTGLSGRWQKISDNPLTICDTGHNADGIKAIVGQISEQIYNHLHFVIGMVSDKDVFEILVLLPKNATYYFCRPDIPRGMDAEELQKIAFKAGLVGNSYSSVRQAYYSAQNNAAANDMIFIGGSTFVVSEVI